MRVGLHHHQILTQKLSSDNQILTQKQKQSNWVQQLMIPSRHSHSWLLLTSNVVFILLLLYTTGVGGANLTVWNNCSEPIWAVVQSNSNSASVGLGDEVPVGRSLAFQKPDEWAGRVWAQTGCTSNSSSCITGGDKTAVTLAEFGLRSPADFYDVSLVEGFNLPLLVEPIGGSGCKPTGCVHDINQVCPPELRTDGGAACQGPCTVFKTNEFCCTDQCGPTNYSQLFKKVCPTAYSYPRDDDATSLFTCTAADYFITFCPSNDSVLAMPPAAYTFNNSNPQQRTSPAPHPTPPPTEGANRAAGIGTIAFVGIVVVIVVISCTMCVLRRRRHSQNDPKRKWNQQVENLLLQHGAMAPKRYRYSEIKKISKSFSDKLGQGGFGSVYKGMLTDGRLVAVKILTDQVDSNGEEFVNEVASISRTSHVNIVSFLGFCYEGNKRALIYEYMPNKSLDKFLGELDLEKLYGIAVGIAKGLQYLHTGCTTRIVHFDIKPQNILLDDDFCPKISDFGLAKLCKKQQSILSMLGTRGTAGYIAPEVFSRNFGAVSHKSDVYSYGMMLLEMGGARKNIGTVVIQSSENYFPDKIYEQVIIGVTNNLDEVMIEVEEEMRRKMLLIGFWCIQTIPSDRPSISKVVEMLEGRLESIQIPPKPFLFSPVPPHQETSSSFSPHVDTQNSDGY